MKENFAGQLYMPDLKHNKEFIKAFEAELNQIMGSKEALRPWICSENIEGYGDYCRRMAHVAALRKMYWEKKAV